MEKTTRLLTVREFLKNRDWPTATSIRWYIHRNVHGFNDKCAVRIGKRVLIDPIKFEEWIHENAK